MNKVRLSLSILSLCSFMSVAGWAGEYYYNNPLSHGISKKEIPPPQPTMISSGCVQRIITTRNNQATTTEEPCPVSPIVVPLGSSCTQIKTTTYSNGKITTVEAPCPIPQPPLK
ncbi:MAG: hypothetical protein HC877_15785 [Thioploca sp.]|nr:hypothetical protein [Thioploca sp.]